MRCSVMFLMNFMPQQKARSLQETHKLRWLSHMRPLMHLVGEKPYTTEANQKSNHRPLPGCLKW